MQLQERPLQEGCQLAVSLSVSLINSVEFVEPHLLQVPLPCYFQNTRCIFRPFRARHQIRVYTSCSSRVRVYQRHYSKSSLKMVFCLGLSILWNARRIAPVTCFTKLATCHPPLRSFLMRCRCSALCDFLTGLSRMYSSTWNNSRVIRITCRNVDSATSYKNFKWSWDH